MPHPPPARFSEGLLRCTRITATPLACHFTGGWSQLSERDRPLSPPSSSLLGTVIAALVRLMDKPLKRRRASGLMSGTRDVSFSA